MIESRGKEIAAVMRDLKILDFSDIPQRKQDYPASDRAKKIVQKSKTMDTLFSAVYPTQWSSAAAPELHDELARCKAAGFKVLAVCPSADSLETDIKPLAQALMAYYKKFSEHPDRYKIVRTAADIDTAIAEGKLGIVFTHQGTALFGGDVEMVGLWRQRGDHERTGRFTRTRSSNSSNEVKRTRT